MQDNLNSARGRREKGREGKSDMALSILLYEKKKNITRELGNRLLDDCLNNATIAYLAERDFTCMKSMQNQRLHQFRFTDFTND